MVYLRTWSEIKRVILRVNFTLEQFDTYREKYSNPETKYYKKLYEFDILPRQCLKQFETMLKKAQTSSMQTVFYTIEDTIKLLLAYSHYNKCCRQKFLLEQTFVKINAVITRENADLHSREAGI